MSDKNEQVEVLRLIRSSFVASDGVVPEETQAHVEAMDAAIAALLPSAAEEPIHQWQHIGLYWIDCSESEAKQRADCGNPTRILYPRPASARPSAGAELREALENAESSLASLFESGDYRMGDDVTRAGFDILQDLRTALSSVAPAAEGWVLVPREVVAFLNGEGTLEGRWFGEYPTVGGRPQAYWWRKHLPDAPSAAQPGDK